ncbi:antitermination regulator [Pollutimonas subterranea]|uniref:Antitermination regulator n=1 Tax=Pollutimonas subterranea TaxID=2045210 RepID=A0A2N4U513_9BURK|nr:nitrate- and nitrite sensing domain-containing protein [Pollutimonas subterranea]PLC50093.1 antitermination regulator [Pollutimonas subterranea]
MSNNYVPPTLRFLLAARRCELHALESLAGTCELVVLAGKLVHALQKERGWSNLYLCSEDDDGLPTLAELGRHAADAEHEMRRYLDDLDAGSGPASDKAHFFNCVASALHRLEALPGLRRGIRDRRTSAQEAESTFTDLIASLLAMVFEAADSALDPDVTRILVALLNFIQGKELSGQERAYGVVGFQAGYFTEVQKARMAALVAARNRSVDVFTQFAPPAALQCWEGLDQQSQDVQRMQAMLDNTSESQRVGVALTEVWLDLCTQRIDGMRNVENLLAKALAQQCEKRIAETRKELGDRSLLLRRFTDRASGKEPSMVFRVQGRIADIPPQDGIGRDMDRSIVDILREQTLRMQDAADALTSVRRSLDERKQIEKAKWLLVSRYHLSEQQAHERMQRVAMDGGLSLGDIAGQLLNESRED